MYVLERRTTFQCIDIHETQHCSTLNVQLFDTDCTQIGK